MSVKPVKNPTRQQQITLRLMIVMGFICMGFFMDSLLRNKVVGYRPLYWLLITTFVYTFFKILYEWYHYWAIKVPVTPPTTRQYTVDIFTTFFKGEPYEMIIETLTAIQAITYPHETYLCDEADDQYLKGICKELGVHHVTRTIKVDAKAGNINNALRQSKGELCVVLDPDHVPFPNFLDPIVSHFDNPEIGYVQVVQAYYNQDTGWIAKGSAQQTYQFYGPMMMCMNSYGTVQAIGANCTFRRTALESIGGHAAGLAEDMHTAMQMHAKNWKSVYVPQVLARGLVPATLSAYYKQQIKWSRGVFELLVTSYVKLFTKFTWRQKLHYGLLPLFYLSGFVFLINFCIPVISLFADVYPLKIDFSDFLVISIPFITSVVLIRHYVQQWVMEDEERGFHIIGGLLLIGSWWVFILGFIYTIIRKNVPYIPTPKDVREEKNLGINMPNIAVIVISLAAIVYGLYNDWNPFTLFMAGIASLNCLFMAFMLIASSELKFKEYSKNHYVVSSTYNYVKFFKRRFWLLRRQIYAGIRRVSLTVTILVICTCIYIAKRSDENTVQVSATPPGVKISKSSPSDGNTLLNYIHSNKAEVLRVMGQQNSKPVNDVDTLAADNINVDSLIQVNAAARTPKYYPETKGVIYTKGQFWFKNLFPLNKQTIERDFDEMKVVGVNTVKIYGPNIYDHITFDVARQKGIKIDYSFWIPYPSAFIYDTSVLNDLEKTIINTVKDNKGNKAIHAWNIGNNALQELTDYYAASQLPYAQYNYIQWVKKLVKSIKAADSSRPVTIDLTAGPTVDESMALMHAQVPELDAFGLIVGDRAALTKVTTNLKAPYFYSSLNPKAMQSLPLPAGGVFYANWQDQKTASIVTFDGLKDIWGRNKPYLGLISASWHGGVAYKALPPVKILRPALTAIGGNSLPYNAMVYSGDKWNLAVDSARNMTFEWYLVRTNGWGKPVDIQEVGKGPRVYVTIPWDMQSYRLYLIAAKGKEIVDASSILNIPLNDDIKAGKKSEK